MRYFYLVLMITCSNHISCMEKYESYCKDENSNTEEKIKDFPDEMILTCLQVAFKEQIAAIQKPQEVSKAIADIMKNLKSVNKKQFKRLMEDVSFSYIIVKRVLEITPSLENFLEVLHSVQKYIPTLDLENNRVKTLVHATYSRQNLYDVILNNAAVYFLQRPAARIAQKAQFLQKVRNCLHLGAPADAALAGDGALLHMGSRHGNIDFVETLLNQGAYINNTDSRGCTPLFWACCHGHTELANLLLARKAQPNIRNKEGNTPLHESIENDHRGITELLLNDVRTDVTIQNSLNESALALARRKERREIASMIEKKLVLCAHSQVKRQKSY